VMACPCSLYLAKLLLPETETPETRDGAEIVVENKFANPIDALASGISEGLRLALNVAAMLIGFIAIITLFNSVLSGIKPLLVTQINPDNLGWWPDNLTLQHILGWVFRPVALLMGVPIEETGQVGSLLGIKLVVNEHVAFLEMTKNVAFADLSLRSKTLAVYALTGFANFASVGIQLGGIGAIAEGRRADLARLGMRALFIGFVATLVNAAVAGILLN
jgi:concentrative nucleoside transporter, CNT family